MSDHGKLHLGCGRVRIPGFFHIDLRPDRHIDWRGPVEALDFIPDNQVELIYASHVLEHFGRFEYREVLSEWFRVLRPGGVLRLAVPDFAACARVYLDEGMMAGGNGLIGLVCGGQQDEWDLHKMIFDEPLLTRALRETGFSAIRHWDWRTVEHADIDDYSQAYLPHLDKTSGVHMSLNLEAVK
jgi:predicted SAM-dependent methyltransferase